MVVPHWCGAEALRQGVGDNGEDRIPKKHNGERHTGSRSAFPASQVARNCRYCEGFISDTSFPSTVQAQQHREGYP